MLNLCLFVDSIVTEIRVSLGICIIAHEPLASALKICAQHIFSATSDASADDIVCFDVPSNIDAEQGYERARTLIEPLLDRDGVLVFTDLLGATPSNIAHRFLDNDKIRILSGVNLPAVVTALSAPPDAPLSRVMLLAEGGARSAISTAIGHSALNG